MTTLTDIYFPNIQKELLRVSGKPRKVFLLKDKDKDIEERVIKPPTDGDASFVHSSMLLSPYLKNGDKRNKNGSLRKKREQISYKIYPELLEGMNFLYERNWAITSIAYHSKISVAYCNKAIKRYRASKKLPVIRKKLLAGRYIDKHKHKKELGYFLQITGMMEYDS